MPAGLDQAHFLLLFDKADPGDKLYLKTLDPNKKPQFSQSDTDGFESIVVDDPAAGNWTIRAAIRAGAGFDVGYTLLVDNRPKITTSTTTASRTTGSSTSW